VVASVHVETDIQAAVAALRNPDHTHNYGNALRLLDWDWSRRQAGAKAALAKKARLEAEAETKAQSRRRQSSDLELIRDGGADGSRGSGGNGSVEGTVDTAGEMGQDHDRSNGHINGSSSAPDSPSLSPSAAASSPLSAYASPTPTSPSSTDQSSVADELEAVLDTLLTTPPSNSVNPTTASPTAAMQRLVELCKENEHRASFVQALNERRTGEVEVPCGATFDALGEAFSGILSVCEESKDVKHAKQMMVMSDTFYCVRTTDESVDDGMSGGKGDGRGKSESGGASEGEQVPGGKEGREYLQQRLKKHQLWTQRWFWEDALLTGVTEAFELSPQDCPWEDLEEASLHDHVLRVHMTVYAQLHAILMNMAQFGE